MRSRGASRESEWEKGRARTRGHTSQFIHSHMFDVMCCVLCVRVCVCVYGTIKKLTKNVLVFAVLHYMHISSPFFSRFWFTTLCRVLLTSKE